MRWVVLGMRNAVRCKIWCYYGEHNLAYQEYLGVYG